MEEQPFTVARSRVVRVQIDLNSRNREGYVIARLSRANGPVAVGGEVTVFEPDDEVAAPARVTRIDRDRGLIYLDVDWALLGEDVAGKRQVTMATRAGANSSNSASPSSMLLNVSERARKFLPAYSSAGVRVVNRSGLVR